MSKEYKPILIAQIYLTFVLMLFIFGPMKWVLHYPFQTVGFLILAQIFLFIGYTVSVKKIKMKRQNLVNEYNLSKKILYIIIGFSLIMNVLILYSRHGLLTFSYIVQTLSNFGDLSSTLYSNKIQNTGSSFLTMFSTFTSPITYLAIPLTLYYFSKLNLGLKTIGMVNIILECLKWLLIGTNKGLIDLFLIFIAIYYLKRDVYKKSNNIIKGLVVLTALGVLVIFSINISSRIGDNIFVLSSITNGTEINLENSIYKWLPESLKYIYIFMTIYLTQGFYAIDLAFQTNFIPMFGVGNSSFLIEKLQGFINMDVYQYTYQSRLELLGWSGSLNWHSAYLWFANDVSLIGIFPLMFLIGYYFYFVCSKAIYTKRPIYVGLFCLMVQLIFYIPMNNQVLSHPSTFMPFVIYNLILIVNSKKIVRK